MPKENDVSEMRSKKSRRKKIIITTVLIGRLKTNNTQKKKKLTDSKIARNRRPLELTKS